ncbi:MAG: toluene tolerance protein [Nitrospirae bacterium]|nr:MAG: toluene tolerance protein [Nitrospirota bacterium]
MRECDWKVREFLSKMLTRVFVFLILAGLAAVPAHGFSPEPADVVKQFQETLVTVMKQAERLGYRGRYQQLESAVLDTHDIPFVARIIIGRYWNTLSPKEQALFVQTFQELSVATYASRFDGYDGEQFRVIAQKPLPREKVLVETRLIQSNGKQRQFNYLLRRVGETWRIINIVVDGVSDLALKRAEYTSLIKQKGFSALLAKMRAQISRYENGQE